MPRKKQFDTKIEIPCSAEMKVTLEEMAQRKQDNVANMVRGWCLQQMEDYYYWKEGQKNDE